MSEERNPIGYDAGVLAGLLRDIRDELHQLNARQEGPFKRLFSNIYILLNRRPDASN